MHLSNFTAHCTLLKPFILVTHIAQKRTLPFEHFKMIWYCISQRKKIAWFYAETKSIKFTQQKFKEHFNVAQAPRKPTILSLVNKFLTSGSEMLDRLILTFSKEGIGSLLQMSLNSFFDVFEFSYCCCASCDKHSCKAKGY